jgi:glycosyltransferase involved in cell wall biosynthesis
MKKVLVVVDRPSWAFDTIGKEVAALNDREFEFEIFYVKGSKDDFPSASRWADLIFFMHWSLSAIQKNSIFSFSRDVAFRRIVLKKKYPFIDYSRAIAGIHGHHDHDDRRSQPDNKILPPPNLIAFLAQFKNVNAVSNRLVRFFREAGLSNVAYTPNGVNTDSFKPMQPLNTTERLRVGCSGTKKRDWKEGITEFIEPLAELPFVDLKIATPENGRYVPREKMPEFLNDIDVYVLASSTEGFPLKVLEPSACGRAVVTTRVGGCEDLIIDGENGFFVDRSIESIAAKLRELHKDRNLLVRMGRRNREIVEERWSWIIRAKDWLDFIQKNIG